MKKVLATILAILFMLPVFALALDAPSDLDHGLAVIRIADAKVHFLNTGEGLDYDEPPVVVIGDYLDLLNTGSLNRYQRLVIIYN